MTYNIYKVDNTAQYNVGETSTDSNNNVIVYVRTLIDISASQRLSVSDEHIVSINPNGIYRTFINVPANNYFWVIDESATKVGGISTVNFKNNGSVRWVIALDGVPDSADNIGSNLCISRYDNDGKIIDTPFMFKRQTGELIISGDTIIAGKLTTVDPLIAPQTSGIAVSKVAVTGNYQDLLNLPKIPTKLSHLHDDNNGSVTNARAHMILATVATTGNYHDLRNVPLATDISSKADIKYVDTKVSEVSNSLNLLSAFVVKRHDLVDTLAIINTKLDKKIEASLLNTKVNDMLDTLSNMVSFKPDKADVDRELAILTAQCSMKADSNQVNVNIENINNTLLTKVNQSDIIDKFNTVEKISNKNIANGYVGLDGSGKISSDLIPAVDVGRQVEKFIIDVSFHEGFPVTFGNVPLGWTVSTLTPGVVQIINNIGYPASGAVWGPTDSDGTLWTQRVIGTNELNFSYNMDAPNEVYISGISEVALGMMGTVKIKLLYVY